MTRDTNLPPTGEANDAEVIQLFGPEAHELGALDILEMTDADEVAVRGLAKRGHPSMGGTPHIAGVLDSDSPVVRQ